MKPTLCALIISSLFSLNANAQEHVDANGSTDLPDITVTERKVAATPASASDSALLLNVPGYATAAGGGVSALPVLNGFAADRLKVRINGMEITSACGNQMNSPMSYIAPDQVGDARVIAGITPVSVGGDSIGGTIELASKRPRFALSDDAALVTGNLGTQFRSINRQTAISGDATVATNKFSVNYSGSRVRANSYRSGDGTKVLGSLYESNNHALTLAARGQDRLLTLRIGQQYIPFQGFPNQYMDMTANRATFVNLDYKQHAAWGELDFKLYGQETTHTMGFFSNERPGRMPMNTHGRDIGYALTATLPVSADGSDLLRIGQEFHSFHLNDYWPPVPGSMSMGPGTYLNINHGSRDRIAFFSELEHEITPRMNMLLGIRSETVRTDTGNAKTYGNSAMNATDVAAAAAFNGQDRARTDTNIDLTALLRFKKNETESHEFGYARKTRSPNLYERYTWGRGTMAMRMTNWFGDGNGYVGNINLKPEVAHTFSSTSNWHGAGSGHDWSVTFSPYYTYVQNYIDADVVGSFHPYGVAAADGNLLRFANHDAQLFGMNLSWALPLPGLKTHGDFSFSGHANVTRGKRVGGGDLYHMMPFNALLVLNHDLAKWHNTAEVKFTASKTLTDSRRLEPQTASYTLVNLTSRYQMTNNVAVTAGISNLFDRRYDDALGGVYLSGLAKARSGALQPLPGYGRSLDVGVALKF